MQLLESHGYWVVFLVVLLDFLGAPITSIPLLVIAGALAASDKLSLTLIVVLAMMASALGDALWYVLGRIKGQKVIGMMCKLSRDRQRCVTRSTAFAAKYGAAALLVSKFIPGVAAFAPPAAGAASMSIPKFLLWDGAGSLLWAAIFSAAGYLLTGQAHVLLSAMASPVYWGVTALALLALLAAITLRRYLKGRTSSAAKHVLAGEIDTPCTRPSAVRTHMMV